MEQRGLKGTATVAAPVSNEGDNPGITEHGYALYLNEQHLAYSVNAPFLITGSPDGFNNWLIHLSLLPQHFDAHIRPVIAFLKSLNLPFAIPTNTKHHIAILNGNAGFRFTGQVITIGIDAASDLQSIVAQLAELTANATGPTMPCAYHLTDIISVSHGSLTGGIIGKIQRSIFYGSAIADPLIAMLKSKGEHWPFQNFRPLKPYQESRLLNRQYIPLETLKKEPKGNVIKVIRINHIFNMQWCVLKQGRRYQSFDHYGRDAKDRLAWQYQVHRRLENSGILPKPIELFELQGDTFFAMEYKESVALTEKAAQLAEGHTWRAIPVDRKRSMMAYLTEVVRILHLLHAEGLVHRDVTPSNFIVTDAEQVFAIDIELCYDLRSSEPGPPFTLGTPGFMSPAQAAGSKPSVADDIYSFGALMIAVMTGILPNRLNLADKEALADNLSWFIESSTITSLIVACLDPDPTLRPLLSDVQHVLEVYDTVLITTKDIPFDIPSGIPPRPAATLLTEGFKTLSSMIIQAGHAELMTLILYNRYIPQAGNAFRHDAVSTWLDTCDFTRLLPCDLQLLASELSRLNNHTAHLLRLMSKAEPAVDFPLEDTNLSISRGLAGRGLKLLALTGQNLFRQEPDELAQIVDRITRLQIKDGSWTTTSEMTNAKGHQVTGFSHGVAGITFFLLNYYAKFHSAGLVESITAALDWLKKQRKMEGQKLTWTVSTENKTVDPWLEHGFSGVALAFIKAYEVLGYREYQEIASQVLAYHPEYITSNNCSFGNGLAGLGEVYLEAFRVFGNRIWLERAGAIQGALLNSCYRNKEQCYWLDGTQLEPKPDFWSGNAGILHFLLRITRPDEIHFPNHLIS